jgi:hypothetical protein
LYKRRVEGASPRWRTNFRKSFANTTPPPEDGMGVAKLLSEQQPGNYE